MWHHGNTLMVIPEKSKLVVWNVCSKKYALNRKSTTMQLMRCQCKPRIEQCCSTNMDACMWLPKSGCVVHCIQFWCLARVEWCEWLFRSQRTGLVHNLETGGDTFSLCIRMCTGCAKAHNSKTIRSFFFLLFFFQVCKKCKNPSLLSSHNLAINVFNQP